MLSRKALAISVTFILTIFGALPILAGNNPKCAVRCDSLYKKALDHYYKYDKEVGYLPSHQEAKFHRDWYALKFKAFDIVNNILKIDRTYAKAYYLRARIWSKFCYDDLLQYKSISRNVSREQFSAWRDLMVLANYNAAIKCARNFADGYIGLYNFYVGRDSARALGYLNRAVLLGGHLAYWERAWFYFFREDYLRAKQDMDKAIMLFPGNRSYYRGRAEVNWRLHDYAAAINDVINSRCVDDKLDTDISESDYREILRLCIGNWAPPVNNVEVLDPETVRVDMGVRGTPLLPGKHIVATFCYWRGQWKERADSRLECEF